MPILCAVCDNRSDVDTLCARCKRDLANVDWIEPPHQESSTDVIETVAIAGGRLADLQEKRPRIYTALQTQIIKRLIVGIRVSSAYRDHRGKKHGVRWTVGEPSLRAIAKEFGCSHTYVRRVLAMLMPSN